jgi:hypothetical protein
VADCESESWATPHEAEARVAAEALAVPGDPSVVVAEEDAVEERDPVGTGDPLVQADELVLTVPPEPVPVE